MKRSSLAVAVVVIAVCALPCAYAQKASSKLAAEAKISMQRAREIALKEVPGTIEDGELERENGKLIYSFDIRTGEPGITELQVSAIDGSIVSKKHETPAHEAAEQKQDAAKARHRRMQKQ